jgi:hypothetical protein
MRPQSSKSEKGQSLTELATAFLILLLLVGGAVDLSRAFFFFIALREAAQEGVSYGSYMPKDTTGIAARARASSNTPVNLGDPNVTITPSIIPVTSGKICAGDTIQVKVEFTQFKFIMPLMGTFVNNQPFDLSATAKDTILTPVCP